MRRTAGKAVSVPAEVVSAWVRAKGELAAAKEVEETAKAAVQAALGDAEIGKYGGGCVTFLPQNRTVFNVEKFRTDHPDTAELYAKTTSFRVLRQKNVKEKK